jgi:DNA-binding transcriptional ArsR family regulator
MLSAIEIYNKPNFSCREETYSILATNAVKLLFKAQYRPSTDQVSPNLPSSSIEVRNLIKVLEGEMSRQEIQAVLGLKHSGNFRENYLEYAQNEGFVKMKFADNPNHPNQKYFLTDIGELFREQLLNADDEGISEGVNEGVKLTIEGVNEGVKLELEQLYDQIMKYPGKKASELNEQIDKSIATTERYLKVLKELGYIEFRGAPKTGGYYLKE